MLSCCIDSVSESKVERSQMLEQINYPAVCEKIQSCQIAELFKLESKSRRRRSPGKQRESVTGR